MSIYGAYTTASGGTTSAGTSRTFNELYPSNQMRLGTMGLQALSNVRALSIGLKYMVNDKTTFGAAYHSFSKFDEDDSWYNTTNVYDNPYGTGFGTEVGNEIDFSVHLTLSDMVRVSGGIGIFDPGSFIQNAGGGSDNSTYMYFGLNWRY